VYPVEDFRRLSSGAGDTIDSLETLLAQKPADAQHMPFLPIWNAAQVFHSNVQYLEFQNGSGVRYLTLYAQYAAPINNFDLFYTYQGLSADGRYYISAILPVTHPSLVEKADALTQAEMEAIAQDPKYYPTTSTKLSAEPGASFTPSLEMLDALVTSLNIQ
ncbi:MAG: hypothetical protein IH586_10770, partial [Anaerolineaceae bacterium]|nr:hypothetical protein [Anaerolineaceae bacterium]